MKNTFNIFIRSMIFYIKNTKFDIKSQQSHRSQIDKFSTIYMIQ